MAALIASPLPAAVLPEQCRQLITERVPIGTRTLKPNRHR